MATVRTGSQSALVVVDVQIDVLKGTWDTARVIANVAQAVERARTQGIPVIWVQHSGQDLPLGSPGWRWVPELGPQGDEPVVHKLHESSFEQTTLDDELARRGITHIVLAGAATNWCIRATAYGALDRGYDLTLVKDAHTTSTLELEGGFKVEAEQVVQDLNTVMRWLSYPGRKSSTARVGEIAFSST
jgi:nicotinamidase-related amidase